MHKDIISQNIKYLVYYFKREFESVMCDKCGKVVYKVKDYRERKGKTFGNFDYHVIIKYEI